MSALGGVFEIQLNTLTNDRGLLANGSCCSGFPGMNGVCSGSCDVIFHVCLSHYSVDIPDNLYCKFGSKVTKVFHQNAYLGVTTYQLPIQFLWPGDFSLVIQAIHSYSSLTTPAEHIRDANDRIVHSVKVSRRLNPSSHWTEEISTSKFSSFSYRYRFICSDHQFGPRCEITCNPRNDSLGHYYCREDGSRECSPGWKGEYCAEHLCDCNKDNGKCDKSNECECRDGWEGKRCDVCVRYPGCEHGDCSKPFECKCYKGWSGELCNQAIDHCSKYEPCINGGTCDSTTPGGYTCTCTDGFEGTNCEIENCRKDHQTCINGGQCLPTNGEYKCKCLEDYEGVRCEIKRDWDCSNRPCHSNSTCESVKSTGDERLYRCICSPGYTGRNCEQNINECTSQPCRNGGRCIDGVNSFICLCLPSHRGKQCEVLGDCDKKPCQNGGSCVQRHNGGGTKCECRQGFDGDLCQNKIDNCRMNPCVNGAICEDSVNTFHCRCAPGFTGKTCATKIDLCAGRPCLNGGTCSPGIATYQCHCPYGYQGNYCEIMTSFPNHSEEGRNNLTESGAPMPGNLQFIVALILGIFLPIIVVATFVTAIWCLKKQRYFQKDRVREKNDLAVISIEQNDNNINKNLNLNNKKNNEKSSQKMAPEEVNLFIDYVDDEGTQSYDPPDLRLNFQRNQLHLNKHRSRHKPPNQSYAYQSKVPTKYKEINHDSRSVQYKSSRHTEV